MYYTFYLKDFAICVETENTMEDHEIVFSSFMLDTVEITVSDLPPLLVIMGIIPIITWKEVKGENIYFSLS